MTHNAFVSWKESAAAVDWNIRPFIGGCYRPSNASEFFEDINPATEAPLCSVSVGSAADIDEAVRVARQRFDDGCWSQLPPVRRAEILVRLADLMVERKAELALLDTLEVGKPIRAALFDVERFAAPRM